MMLKKSRFLINFILIALPAISWSQLDTIKGKIISSITLDRPIGVIYVFEKYTSNGTSVDSLGYFNLVPLKQRGTYTLEISAGSHEMMEYKYKSEWSKRKKPKSIVINANCDIDKNQAAKDLKSNNLKLYIFGGIAPIANTKKDSRFEKRFNVEYWDFGCEAKITECILSYNERVFKYLDIKYKGIWRKKVRNDVVGIGKN